MKNYCIIVESVPVCSASAKDFFECGFSIPFDHHIIRCLFCSSEGSCESKQAQYDAKKEAKKTDSKKNRERIESALEFLKEAMKKKSYCIAEPVYAFACTALEEQWRGCKHSDEDGGVLGTGQGICAYFDRSSCEKAEAKKEAHEAVARKRKGG
ncbi:hypothetical protein KKB14_01835 [Patescibacteria group bacterium]|nr:hypothetical protein [Patescibacteria group bacterium]MBU1987281.1 hypothetical protein [Patescibacteria group bacterium]